MTELTGHHVESLTRLRVLVSVLGESAHMKWWRTEFLTSAGLRFLDRLYPRTSCAAAVRATGVAARALHDSNIGRGGVYHLFRLPETLEEQIHTMARGGYFEEVLPELRSSLGDREAILSQLDALATDLPETERGPQRIGSVQDLRRDKLAGMWAGAYLSAFRQGYRVFPYFEAEKKF